jgi:hypothetical protein
MSAWELPPGGVRDSSKEDRARIIELENELELQKAINPPKPKVAPQLPFRPKPTALRDLAAYSGHGTVESRSPVTCQGDEDGDI